MTRKPAPVFTIGYEKSALADVLRALQRAKIKLLVDTRAVAASRRAGFSKRQLAAGLEEAGIAYVHLQKLGTPAEGREAARAGDFKKLWRVYEKHLKTPEAREALDDLEELIRSNTRVCLLCYCRNAHECHRDRISAIMHERTGRKIENLLPAPLAI